MIVEAVFSPSPVGFLTDVAALRLVLALIFGLVVGAVSGLLGVAGGEIVIPVLILGFGAPVKAVGSLSQMVSIPTVLTGSGTFMVVPSVTGDDCAPNRTHGCQGDCWRHPWWPVG